MTRKTGFERADRFAKGLEELHDEGQAWPTLPEIALRACMKDESYMRWRKLANKGLCFIGIERSDTPSKAPYLTYGGPEASASITILGRAGVVESVRDAPVTQSLDLEGPDTQYRLVPE